MSEKKRRWFQIHLSTAIVLMIVSGGLICANVQTFKEYPKYINDAESTGWPFIMNLQTHPFESEKSVPFQPVMCALNIVAGFVLLAAVAKILDRRPFQFHLSTALALILVSGAVLTFQISVVQDVEEELGWRTETDKRGFPFVWWSKTIRKNDRIRWVLAPNRRSTRSELPESVIEWRSLLNDCALGITLAMGTALMCEWRIRRRETRKP